MMAFFPQSRPPGRDVPTVREIRDRRRRSRGRRVGRARGTPGRQAWAAHGAIIGRDQTACSPCGAVRVRSHACETPLLLRARTKCEHGLTSLANAIPGSDRRRSFDTSPCPFARPQRRILRVCRSKARKGPGCFRKHRVFDPFGFEGGGNRFSVKSGRAGPVPVDRY